MPGPSHKYSAACWTGAELRSRQQEWTKEWDRSAVEALVELSGKSEFSSPEALARTAQAIRTQTGRALQVGALSLPQSLSNLVRAVREALLEGYGFVVLTEFPISEVGYPATAKSFAVFSSLVGSLRSQNAQGHLLGHVRDVGADSKDPNTRIYQTNKRQTFHTDSTDAVGLMCINAALQGGQSMLVSGEAVYREFNRRRPDLRARLFEPVATDRRGEVPEGEKPWFEIPVFSWFEDKLTALYQRQYIESAERFVGAPVISEQTREAFDLLDEIMNDSDMFLAMDFQVGDMQFVHNHSLLHDRTAFVDHVEPERRRHLLRTWMSLPGDRSLPPAFRQRYGSIEVGDRGGIRIPGSPLSLCIEP